MRSVICVLFALAVFHTSLRAGDGGQGGYIGPASVIKQSTFVLGAEGQYYLKGQKKLGILGHARYGLAPRFELDGDVGLNRGETYFGAGLTYQMFYDSPGGVGLTLRAGAFSNDVTGGLDLAGTVGNRFSTFSLYGGLNMKMILDPSNAEDVFNLFGGIHIPVRQKIAFVGEIGANINDQDASYFSGGLLFYF